MAPRAIAPQSVRKAKGTTNRSLLTALGVHTTCAFTSFPKLRIQNPNLFPHHSILHTQVIIMSPQDYMPSDATHMHIVPRGTKGDIIRVYAHSDLPRRQIVRTIVGATLNHAPKLHARRDAAFLLNWKRGVEPSESLQNCHTAKTEGWVVDDIPPAALARLATIVPQRRMQSTLPPLTKLQLDSACWIAKQ